MGYREMSDEKLLVLLTSEVPGIGITEVNDSNRETVIAILMLNDRTEESVR